MKRHNRELSRLSLAMVAVLFLAVAPVRAQETAKEAPAAEPADVTVTTSQASIQVSGSASPLRTGLPETVTFSGDIVIHATVVTDPALPTGVTLFIDGKGIRGAGNVTGTVYVNSCEANLSRLFRKSDKVVVTFAFFEDKPGSFLRSKTGVLTINVTYDEATRKLTGATATVGTLDGTVTGTL